MAGDTGSGKTAFALQVASRAAQENEKKVLFFSLEMSDQELMIRELCSRANVNSEFLASNQLHEDQKEQLRQAAADRAGNLAIRSEGRITVSTIRAISKLHKIREGLSLVVVDYLQLIEPPRHTRSDSRATEVDAISRELKQLAVELDVVVVALAQLNRQGTQKNIRPSKHHLKGSSGIGQDADVIWLIHRIDEPGRGEQNRELIVDKVRAGREGSVFLHFNGERTRFEDPNFFN